MDSVFFDTNVCLDIILKKEPHEHEVYPILNLAREGLVEIFFSEGSIPSIIYISQERYKLKDGLKNIIRWVSTYNMISSDQVYVLHSLKSPFKDKEDAYQYFTALLHNMDYLITRNKRDYEPFATTIPVLTPSEFLEIYN